MSLGGGCLVTLLQFLVLFDMSKLVTFKQENNYILFTDRILSEVQSDFLKVAGINRYLDYIHLQ